MAKKHVITFEHVRIRVPCCDEKPVRYAGGFGWCVNGNLLHPLLPHNYLMQRVTYANCKCGKFRARCGLYKPFGMTWDKHVAHPFDERYQMNDA